MFCLVHPSIVCGIFGMGGPSLVCLVFASAVFLSNRDLWVMVVGPRNIQFRLCPLSLALCFWRIRALPVVHWWVCCGYTSFPGWVLPWRLWSGLHMFPCSVWPSLSCWFQHICVPDFFLGVHHWWLEVLYCHMSVWWWCGLYPNPLDYLPPFLICFGMCGCIRVVHS